MSTADDDEWWKRRGAFVGAVQQFPLMLSAAEKDRIFPDSGFWIPDLRVLARTFTYILKGQKTSQEANLMIIFQKQEEQIMRIPRMIVRVLSITNYCLRINWN